MKRQAMTAAAAAVAMLVAASSQPAERVVSGDDVMAVTVNGQPGRLRIDPAAPGLPLLAPDYAARAGLTGGGMLGFGFAYHVGDQRLIGRSQVARLGWGMAGGPAKRRVGWTPRAYANGVDGVVGPAGVEEPVVRFALYPARAGERVATLPMADVGGLFAGWYGSFAQIQVGGALMLVRFDPHHARSAVSAGAAVRLASVFGGRLTDAVGQQEIAFGIERPLRGMAFARPVPIGALSVPALMVRTGGSGLASIPGGTVPPSDADEVVVTAKGKRDPRRDRLTLGADELQRCSSLVFDKLARQVRLSCLP